MEKQKLKKEKKETAKRRSKWLVKHVMLRSEETKREKKETG